MRKSSLVFFVALPVILVLLFVVQFSLCAISVFPESGWLAQPENLGAARIVVALNLKPLVLGAVPSGVIAFAAALALRRMAPEPAQRRSLARTVVVSWLVVWALCWLALYVLLGGVNPAYWSPSVVTQPATLYGLALVALGLYVGVRYPGFRARVA